MAEVSLCIILPLALLILIPAGVSAPVWFPYVGKGAKWLFTDRPMLMPLAVVFCVLSVGWIATHVKIVSCDGDRSVASKQAGSQTASVCTCGCGRHR